MKKRTLLFTPLLFLFINCAVNKNSIENEKKMTEKIEKHKSMLLENAQLDTFPIQSDSIEILAVQINNNLMEIEVAYSGGCQSHLFSLKGSPNISKSLPPIRRIKLVHNSNGDQCKKYIIQKLEIDITELAYKKIKGSQIILKLDGWKSKIIYTFS